jgi:hypothetical protein
MKDKNMGVACSTHERGDKYGYRILAGKYKGKSHLEDLALYEGIMLN